MVRFGEKGGAKAPPFYLPLGCRP